MTSVKSPAREQADKARADELDPLRAEAEALEPRAEANARRLHSAAQELVDAIDERAELTNTAIDIARRAGKGKHAYLYVGDGPGTGAHLGELRRGVQRLAGGELPLPLPRIDD